MLYEGFFPSFTPVARALDFKDENRFIKVWIVVIDNFNDLHDQVGVPVSPGAEIIFFRYDAYGETERSSCSVPWAMPNVRFLGGRGVSRDPLQHDGAHKTRKTHLHNTIK